MTINQSNFDWAEEILKWANEHDIEEDIIPRNKDDLIAITDLDLSHKNLKNLNRSIYRLNALTSLNLGNNQLEIIPRGISGLTNLEELHLNDNILNSLPSEITALTNLKLLDISSNIKLVLNSVQIKWINQLEQNNCTIKK